MGNQTSIVPATNEQPGFLRIESRRVFAAECFEPGPLPPSLVVKEEMEEPETELDATTCETPKRFLALNPVVEQTATPSPAIDAENTPEPAPFMSSKDKDDLEFAVRTLLSLKSSPFKFPEKLSCVNRERNPFYDLEADQALDAAQLKAFAEAHAKALAEEEAAKAQEKAKEAEEAALKAEQAVLKAEAQSTATPPPTKVRKSAKTDAKPTKDTTAESSAPKPPPRSSSLSVGRSNGTKSVLGKSKKSLLCMKPRRDEGAPECDEQSAACQSQDAHSMYTVPNPTSPPAPTYHSVRPSSPYDKPPEIGFDSEESIIRSICEHAGTLVEIWMPIESDLDRIRAENAWGQIERILGLSSKWNARSYFKLWYPQLLNFIENPFDEKFIFHREFKRLAEKHPKRMQHSIVTHMRLKEAGGGVLHLPILFQQLDTEASMSSTASPSLPMSTDSRQFWEPAPGQTQQVVNRRDPDQETLMILRTLCERNADPVLSILLAFKQIDLPPVMKVEVDDVEPPQKRRFIEPNQTLELPANHPQQFRYH